MHANQAWDHGVSAHIDNLGVARDGKLAIANRFNLVSRKMIVRSSCVAPPLPSIILAWVRAITGASNLRNFRTSLLGVCAEQTVPISKVPSKSFRIKDMVTFLKMKRQ